MRYIPQSRYSFDEIVEQCHQAINRVSTDYVSNDDSLYQELVKFEEYREMTSV